MIVGNRVLWCLMIHLALCDLLSGSEATVCYFELFQLIVYISLGNSRAYKTAYLYSTLEYYSQLI